MKRSNAKINRVLPAIAGASVAALFALIIGLPSILDSAMTGAIIGVVSGGVQGLGNNSLWTRIASINSLIITVTFAMAFRVLSIDFLDVSGLLLLLIIAGFLMAFVASFLVTRPLRQLAAATQSIGEQDLSERLPVKGVREIRELAQSFNGMAEALQAAKPAANNCWPMSATNCAPRSPFYKATCEPSSMTFMTLTKSKCSRSTAKPVNSIIWSMICTTWPRPMPINCRSTKPTST